MCSGTVASQHYQPTGEHPHVGTAWSALYIELHCPQNKNIHDIKFQCDHDNISLASLPLLFQRQMKSSASCCTDDKGFLRCSFASSLPLRRPEEWER